MCYRLKLENIGKISKADVKLNGLTVIAGKNGTGKTTVGKALYAIIKGLKRIDMSYKSNKTKSFFNFISDVEKKYKKLNPSNKSHEDIISSLIDLHKDILSTPIPSDLVPTFYKKKIEDFFNEKNLDVKDYKYQINKLIKEISKKEEASSKKTDIKGFPIFLEVISSEFSGNPVNYEKPYCNISLFNKEASISKATLNNTTISFEGNRKSPYVCRVTHTKEENNIETIFIDNVSYLDDLRLYYKSGGGTSIQENKLDIPHKVLHHKADLAKNLNNAIDRFEMYNNFPKICAKIEKIIGGSLVSNKLETDIRFQPKGKEYSVSMNNEANGNKTLFILLLLLKSGVINEDYFIVLDEPERNMHPDMQITFAEVIATFVEAGFKILVTSHSPYFVEALKYFSQKKGFFGEKTSFYFADNDEKEKGFTKIIELGVDIDMILESFTTPISRIM